MTTISRVPDAEKMANGQRCLTWADRCAIYSPRLRIRPSRVPPLEEYTAIIGEERMERVLRAARALRDRRVLEVNATATGGGVAEMLFSSVPFMNLVGVETEWRVIPGHEAFFECTKGLHNLLQGKEGDFTRDMERTYYTTIADTARQSVITADDDIIMINDPQPFGLARHLKKDHQAWLWRCHIDIENSRFDTSPHLKEFIYTWILPYNAAVFSAIQYVTPGWPIPAYIIPPFIDPLSEKNRELTSREINAVIARYNIDTTIPIIAQIGRFDPWKGIDRTIATFHQVRKETRCQLIIAGGIAGDDPEGNRILANIREQTENNEDIRVLALPLDDRRRNWHEVNALQRAADIIMQPSKREGFGLVIAEALWKSKPVVGSNAGGIALQIQDGDNGFYYETPSKTARRIIYLLKHPAAAAAIGRRAHESVKERFLLPDRIGDYLKAINLTARRNGSHAYPSDSITSFHPWYKLGRRRDNPSVP